MPEQIKVKICGMRDAEAALAAADAGADYLGFSFVEGVRRQLSPELGREVVAAFRARRGEADRPLLVGLFRNQDAGWVNSVVSEVGLDRVHLCGDEDEAYMASMERPVFRQVRVRNEWTPEALDEVVSPHLAAGRVVVLDTYDTAEPGGSGKVFDWEVARGVASREGVLLAGGLDLENVTSAINLLSPWGVDVSSGVETDGVKDAAKIRAFIAAARGAVG